MASLVPTGIPYSTDQDPVLMPMFIATFDLLRLLLRVLVLCGLVSAVYYFQDRRKGKMAEKEYPEGPWEIHEKAPRSVAEADGLRFQSAGSATYSRVK